MTRQVSCSQQRGSALLAIIALIAVVAGYMLSLQLNSRQLALKNRSDTVAVLGQARTALISYAMSSQNRPGELPCPDVVGNDGRSDPLPPAGPCVSNTGRLPWFTLGISDLREANGERLWYAVAPEVNAGTAAPINSNTVVTLQLDPPSAPIAAVILAAGDPLTGQNRSAAGVNNPVNYLENDNSNGDANFVTNAAGTFNDQIVEITGSDLLQATERRVIGEVRRELLDYLDDHGQLPYPAAVTDIAQICDKVLNAGLVPFAIGPSPGTPPRPADACDPNGWGSGPSADLPGWFWNDWTNLVWYAVAPGCTIPNCITVENIPPAINNKEAVVIAAGPALGSQSRPPNTITDLLDSNENTDGDLTFEHLPVDNVSNDQIRIVIP